MGISYGMARSASATVPCWRNTLARNRISSRHENEKSISFSRDEPFEEFAFQQPEDQRLGRGRREGRLVDGGELAVDPQERGRADGEVEVGGIVEGQDREVLLDTGDVDRGGGHGAHSRRDPPRGAP